MTDPDSDYVLATDGLSKSFGDTVAVEGVSLSVERGEFFSLLGPSGCGKTTTLRMLAGLEQPDTGTVTIGGRDVTDQPARTRDTNLVFQDLVLFPHMSVAENVGYGLARAGVDAAERERRAEEMLSVVDLAGFGDRDPGELSGGQRQRVALARALVNEPAVLLLDEPLSSLDRALRADLQEELQRVQREVGTTFLYVTHDQDSAMSMSDRIAVMREGQVRETGKPETLYDRPETAFVASFLGDANVVEATVADRTATGTSAGTGDGGRVVVETGDLRFRADAGGVPSTADGRVTAMVRPEGVTVDPTAGADGAPAEVTAGAYKGFYEEYTVTLDDGPELGVRTDRRRRLSVGQRVRVRVTDARLVDGAAGTGRMPVAPDGGDAGID